MLRPFYRLALSFLVAVPLFSQTPSAIRVERKAGTIVVDASDARLDQILAGMQKELGMTVRTVGDLSARVTLHVEGRNVSEVLTQMLSNRASFLLKAAASGNNGSDDVEYVVVMALSVSAAGPVPPEPAQVITVSGAPKNEAGAEARLLTEMESGRAKSFAAQAVSLSGPAQEQVQQQMHVLEQAQIHQQFQLYGKLNNVQSLGTAAETTSIFQASRSMDTQQAYSHYLRTGDSGPLLRADQDRKALEAHQWVIQYEQMKALGIIVGQASR